MIKILLLGIIQGLTEFLPVSSSGHLVIVQHLFNITEEVVFLDVTLHVGTLLALFTYFFKDIKRMVRDRKMWWYVLIVTAMTAMVGFLFKQPLESLFTQPRTVALLLVVNGILLIATRFFPNKERYPNAADSALMGLAQGLAITPGISRSGATITALLARGVRRAEAFRFSFIASLPAIIGAFVFEAKDIQGPLPYSPWALALGVAASYVVGLISLIVLARVVQQGRFHWFGVYTILAGLLFYFHLKP